jgi:hypothetical protein
LSRERKAIRTLAYLRQREQRRTHDPLPERLLKYLRVRPKTEPPCSSTSMTARINGTPYTPL